MGGRGREGGRERVSGGKGRKVRRVEQSERVRLNSNERERKGENRRESQEEMRKTEREVSNADL